MVSGIWQTFGWNSILYIAAMTGISPDLYEAATIDGANKLNQMIHVTLPGIKETIVIMLIMANGRLMNVGWEKAFLLQNEATYVAADEGQPNWRGNRLSGMKRPVPGTRCSASIQVPQNVPGRCIIIRMITRMNLI